MPDRRPSVHRAIAHSNAEELQNVLARDSEAVSREHDGLRPLHLATKLGLLDLVNILLEEGADVNATCKGGATALHYAVLEHHAELAIHLIDKGADVRAPCGFLKNASALHLCSELRASTAVGRRLLDAGASVDASDDGGQRPLHYAARHNALALIQLLLSRKAKPNATDRSGETPLHYAAARGLAKACHLLIDGGADVNLSDADGNNPLHLALDEAEKPAAVARLLLDHGTKIDLYSAILLPRVAKVKEMVAMVKEMIQKNPDIVRTHSRARDLLSTAVRTGKVSLVKLLLSAGCDPSDSQYLASPLQEALTLADREAALSIARHLLDAGADPTYGRRCDLTSPFNSAKRRNRQIYQLMRKYM